MSSGTDTSGSCATWPYQIHMTKLNLSPHKHSCDMQNNPHYSMQRHIQPHSKAYTTSLSHTRTHRSKTQTQIETSKLRARPLQDISHKLPHPTHANIEIDVDTNCASAPSISLSFKNTTYADTDMDTNKDAASVPSL